MNGVYFRKAIVVFPITDDFVAMRFDALEKSGKLDDFIFDAFVEKIQREVAGKLNVSEKQSEENVMLQSKVNELEKQMEAFKLLFSSGLTVPNVQPKGVVYSQPSAEHLIPEKDVSNESRLVINKSEDSDSKSQQINKKPKRKKSKLAGLDMGDILSMADSMDR